MLFLSLWTLLHTGDTISLILHLDPSATLEEWQANRHYPEVVVGWLHATFSVSCLFCVVIFHCVDGFPHAVVVGSFCRCGRYSIREIYHGYFTLTRQCHIGVTHHATATLEEWQDNRHYPEVVVGWFHATFSVSCLFCVVIFHCVDGFPHLLAGPSWLYHVCRQRHFSLFEPELHRFTIGSEQILLFYFASITRYRTV